MSFLNAYTLNNFKVNLVSKICFYRTTKLIKNVHTYNLIIIQKIVLLKANHTYMYYSSI